MRSDFIGQDESQKQSVIGKGVKLRSTRSANQNAELDSASSIFHLFQFFSFTFLYLKNGANVRVWKASVS